MKKLRIFASLFLVSVIINSCGILDKDYKLVSHGGINIEAPLTWKITKDKEDGAYTLELEPLAADNIVIVTAFEGFRDWEELMEIYQSSLRNSMPQSQQKIRFSDLERKVFHEMESYECEFDGAYTMLIYKGRIIVFDDDSRTYSFLITGSKRFIESEQLKHILDSFKIESK